MRLNCSAQIYCTLLRTSDQARVAAVADQKYRSGDRPLTTRPRALRDEVRKVWKMDKVIILPVLIGALGAVSQRFARYMQKMEANIKLEIIQKTAFLGTARLLRKIMSH